jgi:hypothetical protein
MTHRHFTRLGAGMAAVIASLGAIALPTTPGWAQTIGSGTTELAQAAFSDIGGNIYQADIIRAANLGFIAGPGDGTFRPNNAVTREQAVSILLSAIGVTDDQTTGLPNRFQDVTPSRWSADKIAYAAANDIVTGYADGTFRPTQTVTRAELMAMLKKVSDRHFSGRPLQPTFAFADTSDHWANDTIAYMSGYCNVATPLNEQGVNFAPNAGATRAFTAAAIVRLYDCSAAPPATGNTTPPPPSQPDTTTLAASYETFSLAPGFLPDPATGSGISGGADAVPSQCGFGGDINLSGLPDHVLTVEQSFNYVRIFVTSSEDVSLVMRNSKTGGFTCVDDSNGTLLPEYEGALAAGTYDIWIGDFAPSNGFAYDLNITEFPRESSAGTAAPSTAGNSAFARELLEAHNRYRAEVGASTLTWSPTLATSAQRWADQLASENAFYHSDRTLRNGAGENLAAGGPPGAYTLTGLVDLWGAEQQYFIPGKPFSDAASNTGSWQDIGHYTQIIWRNTTSVGCGLATNANGDILVCHYDPAGNVIDQVP